MSTWTLGNSSSTKDPRVRVGRWGTGNWRTLVQDGGDWDITGPAYPTKRAAYAAVDDVLAGYFGEAPTRAQLQARIDAALAIAAQDMPGCANKGLVIKDMAEALGGTAPDGVLVTRERLIDALTRLEIAVPVSGPLAGKVLAGSFADALLAALRGTA